MPASAWTTALSSPPRVTFPRVVVSVRGPGQSSVLPSACCVGSLRSVGRCGRCSCWCRCRVRAPPPQSPSRNSIRARLQPADERGTRPRVGRGHHPGGWANTAGGCRHECRRVSASVAPAATLLCRINPDPAQVGRFKGNRRRVATRGGCGRFLSVSHQAPSVKTPLNPVNSHRQLTDQPLAPTGTHTGRLSTLHAPVTTSLMTLTFPAAN